MYETEIFLLLLFCLDVLMYSKTQTHTLHIHMHGDKYGKNDNVGC